MNEDFEKQFLEEIINLMKDYHKTEIQKVFPNCETVQDIKNEYMETLDKLRLSEKTIANIHEIVNKYYNKTAYTTKNFTIIDNIHNETANQVSKSSGKIYNDVINYTSENTDTELLKSLKELQDSVESLQNTVNSELEDTNKKISDMEFLKDSKRKMDINKENEKYKELELKFIEKYNLPFGRIPDRVLLSLMNYCLTFKTMIFIQGECAQVQILKYSLEKDLDKNVERIAKEED